MQTLRSDLLESVSSTWRALSGGELSVVLEDGQAPPAAGSDLPAPVKQAIESGETLEGGPWEGTYWWVTPSTGETVHDIRILARSSRPGSWSPVLGSWARLIGLALSERSTADDLVEQLVQAWDRLSFLYQLTQVVRQQSDLQAMFTSIAGLLRQVLSVEEAFLIGGEGESGLSAATSGRSTRALVPALQRAQAGDRPLRLSDLLQAGGVDGFALDGIRDLLVVPMAIGGQRFGYVGLINPAAGEFDSNDGQLLAAVGEQVAALIEVALARGQHEERLRLEHELTIASNIQSSLLPSELPTAPRLDMAGYLRPASRVGGDFYDVAMTLDGATMVLLADVAGKGIPAALLTSTVHSAFHAECARCKRPGELLERMNRLLYPDLDRSNAFVTAVAAKLEPSGTGVEYASAGHVEPMVWQAADASLTRLEVTGLPLGIEAGTVYSTASIPFHASDVLLLYSDGVTEAEAEDGKVLGVQGLSDLLYAAHPASAADQVGVIVEALDVHRGSIPLRDDVALLVARALPDTPSAVTARPFVLPAVPSAIRALVDWTRREGRSLPLPEETRRLFIDEFALAVTEIFSNQIEHAYGRKGGRVQGRLSVGDDWIRADVYDSGVPFEISGPDVRAAIDPADPPERGYGLQLARALTDRCEYERLEGGRNHWTLVKSFENLEGTAPAS